MTIPLWLLILGLVCFFLSGYGYGAYRGEKMIEAHDEEVDALCETIDALYEGLAEVYIAFTGQATEEQAEQAAKNAEYLLTTVESPDEVEAAATV